MSKSRLQIFSEGRQKRHTKTWKKSSRTSTVLLHHCHTWFVETVNTPLYHKHLSRKDIIQICKHLVEKNGIRSIERITGFHRDTIGRLLEELALHAELVNDILLNEIKLGQFEVDEMWTTIKKNRKKLSREAQIQMKKVMPGSIVV
jgi:hypothetical protein